MGINISTIFLIIKYQRTERAVLMKGKNKYFTDYDFEEAYQKQIDNLQQAEIERLMKNRKGIAYQTKTTKAGNQLEADIYPAFGNRQDAPRTKRGNKSRPAQKNLNDKRAKRYLNNLISANFGKGDIWATFTYDEEHLPESPEDADRIFANYIRRINRRRRKAGKDNAKYIVVTEWSDDEEKGIRCHHHVIIDGSNDRDELENLWRQGSRNHTRRIDPDPDTHAAGIANYITKDPHGRKRWRASKNLKKPIVTKSYSRFGKRTAERMATDRGYLEERITKAYPGYKFIDAEVKINDINGGFYIYARLRRD